MNLNWINGPEFLIIAALAITAAWIKGKYDALRINRDQWQRTAEILTNKINGGNKHGQRNNETI